MRNLCARVSLSVKGFFFILFSVRLFFRFENGRWLFEVNEWLLKLRRLLLRTRDINQVISFSSAWRNGNISKNTYTARICLRLLAAAQRTAMSNYITACVYLSSSSSFSALPLPRLMIGHYTNTTEDDCDWHSPLVLLSRSLRYVCSARTAQTDGRTYEEAVEAHNEWYSKRCSGYAQLVMDGITYEPVGVFGI